MRKLLLSFALIILLFSTTAAQAASDTVTPLKKLSAIGRLSQSIGLNEDQIQAELDVGKTLEQIAKENGMPESMFKKRIINANFSLSSASKAPVHNKKTTKVIKSAKKKLLTHKKTTPKKKLTSKNSEATKS